MAKKLEQMGSRVWEDVEFWPDCIAEGLTIWVCFYQLLFVIDFFVLTPTVAIVALCSVDLFFVFEVVEFRPALLTMKLLSNYCYFIQN